MFRDRLSVEELRLALERAGLSPQEVMSTRSRPYRELGLHGRAVDDDELLALMVENPALIRRPLVIGPGGATVGFNVERLRQVIGTE
jgi:arsenate reductase